MEAIFPLLFLGGLIFFVVMLVIWANKMAKKRREDWQALGQKLNLEYNGDNRAFHDEHASFAVFGKGRGKMSRNSLTGNWKGFSLVAADYEYVTGYGRSRQQHNLTLFLVSGGGLSLPKSFLRQKMKFLDALGKMFGGQDIRIDEDHEFVDRFVLQGQDEAGVRATYDPQVRSWFKNTSLKNLQVETFGDGVLVISRFRVKPENFEEWMDTAIDLANAFGAAGGDGGDYGAPPVDDGFGGGGVEIMG